MASCAGPARRLSPTAQIVAGPRPLEIAPPAPVEIAAAEPVAPAASAVALDPKGLIRKGLLADALVALKRHAGRIANRDRMYIVDFKRHSSQGRLYALDLRTGEVETFRTAHGFGSDPRRTGWARSFSNTPNSKASSVGAYVTAGQSEGARDGANVLLEGLEPTNSHARERAIIVHAAAYCEPSYLASQGMLGRSDGCFAVSRADLKSLRPAMDSGRLIFAGA
jgi:hypothetical protein